MQRKQLLNYQEQTIKAIISHLAEKNVAILEGNNGLGKSYLINELKLPGHKTYILKGHYKSHKEELGVFKEFFFNENSVFKSFLNDTTTSLANSILSILTGGMMSFIDYSNTLNIILNKESEEDIIKIVTRIETMAKEEPLVLVFDEIILYDFVSIFLLDFLLYELNNSLETNIKIVVVLDLEENYDKNQFKYLNKLKAKNLIALKSFTQEDSEFLKLDKQISLDIVLANEEDNMKVLFVEDLISKLNLAVNEKITTKVILQTIQLFDEPISLAKLSQCIPEYNFHEIEFCLENLVRNNILEKINDDEKMLIVALRPVLRHEMDRLTPNYIIEYRSDIYLNYLEHFAPNQYMEKFIHNKKLNNVEETLTNGALAYCFVMRENLPLSLSRHKLLLDFINNNISKEPIKILMDAYNFYVKEAYEEAFNILDEKIRYHQYPYELHEVWAEIVYLRILSLGRLRECKYKATLDDIKMLNDYAILAEKANNVELSLRLKETMIYVYNIYDPKKYANDMQTLFFTILECYQTQIRQANLRNKKFWQARYAALGSKVDIIDIPSDKMPLFEKCYEILSLNREEYPKQYLRAACNYAGRNLWQQRYEVSKTCLDDAITFIKKHNISVHWGVIYHVQIITRLIMGEDSSHLLKEYDLLLKNKSMIEKMHEKNISTSNYAVLLASCGKYDKALATIKDCLADNTLNQYDEYLLRTNKSILEYILGNKEQAMNEEQMVQQLINNGVPNFDKSFMRKRHEAVLELFNQNTLIDTVMAPIRDNSSRGSMNNSSDIYFRAMLVSNIAYWVN
ncbi:hypothetical protein GIX45_26345 [Erwinia sp. CPCC 100877]|nr:hypothetical protein [Erwinia sp. CPCC 100877]